MALICDTSGVYSLYDADDAGHAVTTSVVESEAGPLLLPVIIYCTLGSGPTLPFNSPKRSSNKISHLSHLWPRIWHVVANSSRSIAIWKLAWRMPRSWLLPSAWQFHGFSPRTSDIFARSSHAASNTSCCCRQTYRKTSLSAKCWS